MPRHVTYDEGYPPCSTCPLSGAPPPSSSPPQSDNNSPSGDTMPDPQPAPPAIDVQSPPARVVPWSSAFDARIYNMSMILLVACIGTNIYILFNGLPKGASELVAGRILGYLDAITMMVLAYWYQTSHTSARKDVMIAQGNSGK